MNIRSVSVISPELRDTSWAVGFNWGFKYYRGVAQSALAGDESFKGLDISTIQIPDEALETMAKLGVDQFPHVTDWGPKNSQSAPAGDLEPGSTSSVSGTESSPAKGVAPQEAEGAPSSSNAPGSF